MAFALPVWFAVQQELLARGAAAAAGESPSCFNDFDDRTLFHMFHFNRPSVAFITDVIRARLRTLKKAALPVDALVMVALNYYAHGFSSAAVLQRIGLSQTDCLAVVSTLSEVIADMSDQFISFPLSRDARASVASKTRRFCGIPAVLGVLAPAHFKIRASPYETDSFRSFVNTAGYTSVVSQIICDPDGNILSVGECCVGSACEQEMWGSSSRGREIEEDAHGPYWVIGGGAYRLSKHVLTAVSEPANEREIRFNEAHAKIHGVMQTTLASLKKRFRCLAQLGFAQEGSLDKKSNIIKACCILHNIAKKFSVPPPLVGGKIEPLHPGKRPSVQAEISPEALRARQELIDSNFSVASGSQDTPSNSATEEPA